MKTIKLQDLLSTRYHSNHRRDAYAILKSAGFDNVRLCRMSHDVTVAAAVDLVSRDLHERSTAIKTFAKLLGCRIDEDALRADVLSGEVPAWVGFPTDGQEFFTDDGIAVVSVGRVPVLTGINVCRTQAGKLFLIDGGLLNKPGADLTPIFA
jgi:hypothetical protein